MQVVLRSNPLSASCATRSRDFRDLNATDIVDVEYAAATRSVRG